MSNENKIIDKIIADANAEAEEILSQARSYANDKLKEFELEANKQIEANTQTAKSEAVQAKAKEISSADMIAKKRILTTKQMLIAETIEKAKQKLLNQDDEANQNTILQMLKNSKADTQTEIILPEKSSAKLKEALEKAGYKISNQIRDIAGGFVLKQGDIEYNYSFESIIEIERENLELLAAQILFS